MIELSSASKFLLKLGIVTPEVREKSGFARDLTIDSGKGGTSLKPEAPRSLRGTGAGSSSSSVSEASENVLETL